MSGDGPTRRGDASDKTAGPAPERRRNTGYEFDLIDYEKASTGGKYIDPMAQFGPYETRHKALEMKVVLERLTDGYEYEIRASESLWHERGDPVVCDYCGHKDWYIPLVGWTFVGDDPDADHTGGSFCTTECYARWARKRHVLREHTDTHA